MRTIDDLLKITRDQWFSPPERWSVAGLLEDRQALAAEVLRLRAAVTPAEGEGKRSRRRIGEIEATLLSTLQRIEALESAAFGRPKWASRKVESQDGDPTT